jgi:hypothetical protein
MTTNLSAVEYRQLIYTALGASGDADTDDPTPRTMFTPDRHRQALDPDATVVRGARGVGKTFWFKALQSSSLRVVAANEYQIERLKSVVPLVGYGTGLRPDIYPGPAYLRQLLAERTDPHDLWMAVLLVGLGSPEIQQQPSWLTRAQWVHAHPDRYEQALAVADRQAGEERVIKLVLFDALDRLHSSRGEADRLIEGILRLALDLRTRTKSLRAKVFIRPDMYDSLRLTFADASKLTANAASLTWLSTNLYGLFFHQLGNAESTHAATFRKGTGDWRATEYGRHLPPESLLGDQKAQQQAFTEMAGPWMGKDHRKGITYTWLPNHLMDGIRQTSPRSFLRALAKASEETGSTFASHEYALHYDGIRRGVQAASSTRVAEVTEDLPWVRAAMGPLAGRQVPIDRETIISAWQESDLTATLSRYSQEATETQVPTGPRNPNDYGELIEELIEIGIITRRTNGKLDLPDVYRIGFDLGRKGGVPRIQP